MDLSLSGRFLFAVNVTLRLDSGGPSFIRTDGVHIASACKVVAPLGQFAILSNTNGHFHLADASHSVSKQRHTFDPLHVSLSLLLVAYPTVKSPEIVAFRPLHKEMITLLAITTSNNQLSLIASFPFPCSCSRASATEFCEGWWVDAWTPIHLASNTSTFGPILYLSRSPVT